MGTGITKSSKRTLTLKGCEIYNDTHGLNFRILQTVLDDLTVSWRAKKLSGLFAHPQAQPSFGLLLDSIPLGCFQGI